MEIKFIPKIHQKTNQMQASQSECQKMSISIMCQISSLPHLLSLDKLESQIEMNTATQRFIGVGVERKLQFRFGEANSKISFQNHSQSLSIFYCHYFQSNPVRKPVWGVIWHVILVCSKNESVRIRQQESSSRILVFVS